MHKMVLWLVCAAFCLSGCGNNVGSGYADSAWDSYDYRHPVPTGTTGASPYYDSGVQYQDNDSYYTPPTSYGCQLDNNQMCE
jgi:hypothetical protein